MNFAAVTIRVLTISLLVQPQMARSSPCVDQRPFTIQDSLAISYIINPTAYSTAVEIRGAQPVGAPIDSPDHRYFLLVTQRGILDSNEMEATVWIFDRLRVIQWLSTKSGAPPVPRDIVTLSASSNTPVISGVRWVDSTRVAFLGKDHKPNPRVFVVDVNQGTLRPLTRSDEFVTAYDIRGETVAYATPEIADSVLGVAGATEALQDVTGKNIYALLYPPSRKLEDLDEWSLRTVPNILHIARSGRELPIAFTLNSSPLKLFAPVFRLSPREDSLIALAPVKKIPPAWAQYQARTPYFSLDPRSHYQTADENPWKTEEFVLADLATGVASVLVDAPAGRGLSYLAATNVIWASDGHRAVLSNTFLPAGRNNETQDAIQSPAVAMVDIATRDIQRIASLPHLPKGENGWYRMADLSWNGGTEVTLTYQYESAPKDDLVPPAETYISQSGKWTKRTTPTPEAGAALGVNLELSVRENLNAPPALYGHLRGSHGDSLIWSPNSQLSCLRSGEASLYHWTDKSNVSWTGILVLPTDHERHERHPLVIQTHGVSPKKYFADGEFTTGSGGRALAAKGIVVLQMPDAAHFETPENGPDQTAGYEAAIDELSRSGFVDPRRVGVIGFSYTCFHVLYALTHRPDLFRAASITDGNNMSYMQYMLSTDGGNGRTHELSEKTNGGTPFGMGLMSWARNAPNFNLDKVTAPLLISSLEKGSLLGQWETYAGLRSLNKPVAMMWLRKENAPHVLIQPQQRFLSQQLAVDWFSFWLKEEEDPDPAKVEQYKRWRELRKLQSQEQRSSAVSPLQ